MIRSRNSVKLTAAFPRLLALASVVLLSSLLAFGCKTHSHTSDSSLRKIDEMLNSQLPQGTPRLRVEYFLNSRGYRLEDSQDRASLIAVVRLIDTETLIPATARVAFHFDSNEKLLSYELQTAPDAPLRP
jgi:hypothetical protein